MELYGDVLVREISVCMQGIFAWTFQILTTVEHIYDACPKNSELGSFRIIAYLYVSDGSRR